MIHHTPGTLRVSLAIALAATLAPPALGRPSGAATAQEGAIPVLGPGAANYDLAARFAPYKIRDLVHSTRVSPRWIDDSDRFWYEWESSDGTDYYLVDPGRGTRAEIFDNDRIAAELTRITRDPWDGQNLPIRNIRFIDEGTLQFEVQSSQDEEIEEEEEGEEEEEQEDEEEKRRKSRRNRRRKRMSPAGPGPARRSITSSTTWPRRRCASWRTTRSR